MELEKQVVSLELAKKLKEVGYPQEGLFIWKLLKRSVDNPEIKYRIFLADHVFSIENGSEVIAPTVAELGEALPKTINKNHLTTCSRSDKGYFVTYGDIIKPEDNQIITEAETEADARALMLLKLYKEGLIKW